MRLKLVVLAAAIATLASSGLALAASAPGNPRLIRLPEPSVRRPHTEFDKNTVLVRVRSGASARSVLATHGLTSLGPVGRTAYTVARTNGQAPRGVLRALRADPAIQAAQLNYLRRTAAVPNDPLYPQYQKKYFVNIRLPSAYNVTKGSTSWSVAVVDTGVDLNHPDLDGGRLKAGFDFVNNDSNPQDDNGHGTMVAGIAAGITDNSIGIAGAAWKGGIIPVKSLDEDGVGTDAQVAAGIDWAADHGAKVINLSLGGPDGSQALEDAVNYALSKDVVVVAASGNDGTNAPFYPAAFSGVLAVSATDKPGSFAWFSNYGWWVGVSAPGTNIIGPWLGDGTDDVYAIGSGTSFAAPIVSGVAILTRFHNQTWKQATVVSQLKTTARDRGPAGIDPFYGWGWVDAYAAVGGPKQAPAAVPPKDSFEPNGTLDTATAVTGTTSVPTMSPEGDLDWFKYNASNTGAVTFTVTPPAFDPFIIRAQEMDPVLAVYGPDRKLLATKDDTFVGEAETVTVPALSTGDYYLEVSNYFGSQSSSTYTVQVTASPEVPAPTFDPYEAFTPGGHTQSTAIADVTGDGRQDLLVSTDNSTDPKSTLFLYAQASDGTLDAPVPFSTDGGVADDMNLAAGDLDGDGSTDVAVAVTGGVDVFYQSGGTLTGPTLVPTSTAAHQVEISDLNDDGKQDMVVEAADSLLTLVNGDSGFTEATVGTEDHGEIEVGDLSGDGLPDIAALCSGLSACTADTVEVFVQQGDGTFVATPYDATDTANGLQVADVTGDARADVVVTAGSGGSASVKVMAQNSGGTLDGPVSYPSADAPQPVEALDLNGDGRLDVVVGHTGLQKVGVYQQGSTGALGTEITLTVPNGTYSPKSLSIGDLSSDGRPDIAIADTASAVVLRETEDLVQHLPIWVRATTPADFATNVSRTNAMTVTFGRDVDPASITSVTVYLKNGKDFGTGATTLTYDPGTRVLTIKRTKTLAANTPYIVFLDGLTDLAGKPMPPFSFRFTTGA